jgi:hypothetical protein
MAKPKNPGRNVLCKMYNVNRWWSFWWRVPVIDGAFYSLHDRFCPDND